MDDTEETTEEEGGTSIPGHILAIISLLAGLIMGHIRGILIFLCVFVLAMQVFSKEEGLDPQTWYRAEAERIIKNEENDVSVSTEERMLGNALRNILPRFHDEGVFSLTGNTAEKFGEACFVPADNIVIREITLDRPNNEVTVKYELEISKRVEITFQSGHIHKVLTRYEGFSELKSIWRFLKWNLYGKFFDGYPRYTLDVEYHYGDYTSSSEDYVEVQKQLFRRKPFSRITWFAGKVIAVFT